MSTTKQKETIAGQEKLKQAYSLAGEAASEMIDSVKGQARAKLDDKKDLATDLADQAETFIKEKPLLSIGCAFAAGWMVSKILK